MIGYLYSNGYLLVVGLIVGNSTARKVTWINDTTRKCKTVKLQSLQAKVSFVWCNMMREHYVCSRVFIWSEVQQFWNNIGNWLVPICLSEYFELGMESGTKLGFIGIGSRNLELGSSPIYVVIEFFPAII